MRLARASVSGRPVALLLGDVIAAHGGLNRFMGWDRPLLTDSGGFQVFSLGPLRKVSEEGVAFASPVDGDRLFLTPEISIDVQRALDSDIAMVFDECTPYPATEAEAERSMQLSMRWAARSKNAWNSANALTVVLRYATLTGDDRCANVIATPCSVDHTVRPVKHS